MPINLGNLPYLRQFEADQLYVRRVGGDSIICSSGNVVGLTIIPDTTQSVSLFRILDASNNIVFRINASGTIIDGSYEGKLIATNYGGTGLGEYSKGDLIYYNFDNKFARLPIGPTDCVLTSTGTGPQWSSSLILDEGLTLNLQSSLKFGDSAGNYYVGFKAPETLTSNTTWTLPASDGTSGQAIITDGTGNLKWAAAGGALSSGQVTSGFLGNSAVVSGSIGSGQIGAAHLASGTLQGMSLTSGIVSSGYIGNNAVVSGSIASGQIGKSHIGSGELVKGLIAGTNINISVDANDVYTIDASISGGVAISSLYFSSGLILNSGSFYDGNNTAYAGIASGGIISELIADSAVVSGKVASGIIGRYEIADNSIFSGHISSSQVGDIHIASGGLGSGSIGSGQIGAVHLASGTIPSQFALSSGIVTSGNIGDVAVTSGNIASGSIGQFHLSSGAINSGHLASGSVVSNSIASGQVTGLKIASGTITNINLANPTITIAGSLTALSSGWEAFGLSTSSGLLPATYYPSGNLTIGIASGGITSQLLADGAVLSGDISSGQIGAYHLASGVLQSAPATIQSGQITSGYLGDNSVVSGSIASGQVSRYHLSDNSIFSGHISSSAIGSVHIASGSIVSGLIGQFAIANTNIISGTVANDKLTNSSITIAGSSTALGGTWAAAALTTSSGLLAGTYYPSGTLTIGIASGGITSQLIADGAVVSGDVGSSSLGGVHITSGSLTGNNLAAATVANVNLVASTVTIAGSSTSLGGSWAAAALTTSSGLLAGTYYPSGNLTIGIASGGITSQMLADGAVSSGDLAIGAVNNQNIVSGTIANDKLAASTIAIAGSSTSLGGSWAAQALTTSSGLLAGTYYPSGALTIGIASGGINSQHIASGAVVSGDIGNAAVVSGSIASGQIYAHHFNAIGISANYVLSTDANGNLSWVAGGIGSINSGSIGRFYLASGAVNSGHVASGAVVSDGIASGQITSTKIASGAVVSGHLGQFAVANINIISGTVANDKLANSSITIAGISTALGGTWAAAALTTSSGLLAGTYYPSGNLTIGIASGGIISQMLGSGAVASGAIGLASVNNLNINSGTITNDKLLNSTITIAGSSTALGNSWAAAALTTSSGLLAGTYYPSGSLTIGIATAGVVTAMIASGAVSTNQLALGAVNNYNIISGTVANDKLTNSTIAIAGSSTALGGSWAAAALTTSSGLLAGTYYPSGTITIGIASGGLTAQMHGSGSVSSGVIGLASVNNLNINSGTIANDKLVNSSITIAGSSTALGAAWTAAALNTSSGLLAGTYYPSGTLTIGIATAGVVTAMIASGAVSTNQLALGAVNNYNIISGTVANDKLANSSITIAGISTALGGTWAAAALTTSSGLLAGTYYPSGTLTIGIASGGLTAQMHGSGSVSSGAIGLASVNNLNINSGTITNDKLVNSSITIAGSSTALGGAWAAAALNTSSGLLAGTYYPSGSLTIGIATAGVVTAMIASGAVGTNQLASGAVGTNQLALGAVNNYNIISGTIANDKLTNSSISIAGSSTALGGTWAAAALNTSSGLLAGTYYPSGSLTIGIATAGVVTAMIASGAVGTNQLASGAVGTNQLALGAVNNYNIISGTIANDKLTNSTIAIAGSSTALGGTWAAAALNTSSGLLAATYYPSGTLTIGIASGGLTAQMHGSGSVSSGAIGLAAVNNLNINSGTISNDKLVNSSITIAGSSTALGGTWAAAALNTSSGLLAGTYYPSGSLTIGIATAGVLTAMIASGAVGTNQLALGAVNNYNIISGTIANDKLTNSSITIAGSSTALGGSWAAAALTTSSGLLAGTYYPSGALTIGIATAGVVTAMIASGAVGTNQLASGAVSTNQLASGAVSTNQLALGAVNNYNIISGTVANDKLANSTINIAGSSTALGGTWAAAALNTSSGLLAATYYPSGTITIGIASGGLTAQMHGSGSVSSGAIGLASVNNLNINSGTISNDKLINSTISIAGSSTALGGAWAAAALSTSSGLLAGTYYPSGALTIGIATAGVVTAMIASGAVGTNQLALGAVNNYNIISGTIANDKLANSSVTIAGASTALGGSWAAQALTTSSGLLAGTYYPSGALTIGIASGAITSQLLADGSVTSGDVASGQLGINHLAAGAWSANKFLSQDGAGNLTWGTVTTTLTSGSVQSGNIGLAAVNNININSGTIANDKLLNSTITIAGSSTALGGAWAAAALSTSSGLLAGTYYPSGTLTIGIASGGLTAQMHGSGSVSSGAIGLAAVNNLNINSGTISNDKLINSTISIAGSSTALGGAWAAAALTTSSGLLAGTYYPSGALTIGIASGAINSQLLASGAVLSGDIGNNAVLSGSIASGQIYGYHFNAIGLSANYVLSTDANGNLSWAAGGIGSINSGSISRFYLASGAVNSGHVASGAIVSDSIASGQITSTKIASGAVVSGHLGQFTVANINIISGTIANDKLATSSITIAGSSTALGGSWAAAALTTSSGLLAGTYYPSGALTIGIATAGVVTAMIASGAVSTNQLALGAVNNYNIISGTIANDKLTNSSISIAGSSTALGGTWAAAALTTSSGLLAGTYYPSGTLTIGIASGGLTAQMHGSGSVSSGAIGLASVNNLNINSGTIANDKLVNSSITIAGSSTALGGAWAAAALTTSSGLLAGTYYPSGALTIGIASGGINNLHIASGAVVSGDIGNNAVVSGSIAAGQIGAIHLSSGAIGIAGSSGQLQFNAGGVLGASAAVTFASTGPNLGITTQGTGNVPFRISTASGHTTNSLEIYHSGALSAYITPDGILGITQNYGGSLKTNTIINGSLGGPTVQYRSVVIGASASITAAATTGEAVAVGYGAIVYGNYGIAIGQSTAAANTSIAIGLQANSNGASRAIAIGDIGTANATNSCAFGTRATVTGAGNFAWATESSDPSMTFQRLNGSNVLKGLYNTNTTWISNTNGAETSRVTMGPMYVNSMQEAIRMDAASDLARVGIGGAASGRLCVYTGAAANKGVVIQGFTSQSANYLEIQNSSVTSILSFTNSGNLAVGTMYAAYYPNGPAARLHVRAITISGNTVTSPWPSNTPDTHANWRDAAIISDGGNGETTTVGTGTTCGITLGEYYTGRIVIQPYTGGSSSPVDQASRAGRDIMLKGGTSDNTIGSLGGRLFLQGGAGYTSTGFSGNIGVVSIQPIAGQVGIGTTTPSGTLSVTSTSGAMINTIFRGTTSQTGNLTEWHSASGTILATVNKAGGFSSSPNTTALTASQNNYAFDGSSIQRVSTNGNYDITGITYPSGLSAHSAGRFIRLYNINSAGGFNITLKHNSGSSSLGNKFWCVQLQDIVLGPLDYAELIYDDTDNGSGNAGWRVH